MDNGGRKLVGGVRWKKDSGNRDTVSETRKELALYVIHLNSCKVMTRLFESGVPGDELIEMG